MEVTVRGEIDPVTGMVMNVMDHKNLDLDVAIFRDTGLVSTTENLVVVAWDALVDKLPQNAKLYRIKIHETGKNVAEYFGDVAQ